MLKSGVRHGARRRSVCVSGIFAAHALSAAIDDGALPLMDRPTPLPPKTASAPSIVMGTRRRAHLYQEDPQWADRPYGSRTVGDAVPAPLCLAMVRIEATGDASMGPVEAALPLQSSGYADTVGSHRAPDRRRSLHSGPRIAGDRCERVGLRRELVGDPSHHRLHESRLVRIVGHLHRGHRHRRARRTGGWSIRSAAIGQAAIGRSTRSSCKPPASGPTRRPRKVRRSPRHSSAPDGRAFFYGKHALHCWRRVYT